MIRRLMPLPYSRGELRQLRRDLDARWPFADDHDVVRWVRRWDLGISPYSRIRRHAIRLQLDAVIALSLRCGLRRNEIYGLTVPWMHYDNLGVIVWEGGTPWDGPWREVPFTEPARGAVYRWIEFRERLAPRHEHPWLNLWSSGTTAEPMTPDTFNRMLRKYVGTEWTLRRFRDTCAVTWLRAGLPLDHVRAMLGLDTLAATLPYAALVGGSLRHHLARREDGFEAMLAGAEPPMAALGRTRAGSPYAVRVG